MDYTPQLVAVVGGSASGKTWVADQLRLRLGKEAGRVSLDNFYRDRSYLPTARRAQVNFDHPRAIDWPAVESTLQAFQTGGVLRCPRYDFVTHSRLPEWDLLKPRAVLLMDGLWLLHRRSVRQLFTFTIFLDCCESLRLERRIQRDCAQRGRSEAAVRKQFARYVAPMHARFIEPQRNRAHVVVSQIATDRHIDRLAEMIREQMTQWS
jgi:uridine kinase